MICAIAARNTIAAANAHGIGTNGIAPECKVVSVIQGDHPQQRQGQRRRLLLVVPIGLVDLRSVQGHGPDHLGVDPFPYGRSRCSIRCT